MTGEAGFGIAEVWAALRLGAGPAAFGALYALFAKLEDIASPQAKQDIAAWLKRADVPGSLTSWPRQFATLFDQVFGERHLSWHCFFRSCLASLAAVAFMTAIWIILRPDEAVAFYSNLGSEAMIILLVVALICNLIPDYISLMESRFVIGRIGRTKCHVLVGCLMMIADLGH